LTLTDYLVSDDTAFLDSFESARNLSSILIPNLDELPSIAVGEIEDFCVDKSVELEQPLSRFASFSAAPQDNADDDDPLAPLAGSITRTLEYVKDETEKAKEKGDKTALTRIKGVLQSLEAERVAGKVWEAV
jgi:hypothetical protein